MKKLLLLLLLFLSVVLFYVYRHSTEKNINNYIIIDIETKDNPRLYCPSCFKIKLIDEKNNQEIKNYNKLIDELFILDSGNYKLEISHNDDIITENIEKKAGSALRYQVFFNQTDEMKYFDNFTRFFGLGSLLFNFILFFKLLYKKEKKGLLLIFCHLIIMHFLSFTNFFTGFWLNLIQMLVEISLLYSLILYFSAYLKKKNKKVSNYVFIISTIFIVFIILILILKISDHTLVYFVIYHPFILNISIIIFYIIVIIINLSNYFIAYAILINRFLKIKNKDSKRIKVYQILFLTLVFTITILMSFILEASFRFYPKYDVLFFLGSTILFWLLFFEANTEITLKIHRKYKNLYLYVLKVLTIFTFIYIYLIYSNNYSVLIPILLPYILGEVIYYLYKTISYNKNLNSYNKFLNKLKGIDNIEEFQKIVEKEISKKNSLESVKFKIFLDYTENKKYIKFLDDNKIIKKKNLTEDYENYDFGLKINAKNDVCIALLLIKTKNEKYLKELITSLSVFMDDLVYIINYIRTLNLKNDLEKDLAKEELSKVLEEHLTFIKEFSLLIEKKTKEDDIKKYSNLILQNVKELGDKLE